MKKLLVLLLTAGIAMTLTCCNGSEPTSVSDKSGNVSGQSSAVKKQTDYLVLVNRTHPLPKDYENSVTLVKDKNFFGNTFQIEKQTYEHFKKLREKLMLREIQIEVNRAYLTADEQTALIEKYTKDYGKDYAYNYQGNTGYSENQTGLSIDLALYFAGEKITSDEELIKMSGILREVHAVMAEYGFILRYPEDKVQETDFMYQPWHIRYVGEKAAKEIYEEEITLEEYLGE